MINLLLSLSLYEFYIFQNEDSYFQPIPYLKYEFNKNSDFNITFHRVDEQFVFGLATAKEIKEIEKIKDDSQYCYNLNKLSEIQFNIIKNQKISGTIPKKSILTPYIFSCNGWFTLDIDFEYLNGNNHLDYRLQNFLKFSTVYAYLQIISFIFFNFYMLYFAFQTKIYDCKKHKKATCNFYRFLFTFDALFGLLCVQPFYLLNFYETREKDEYFNFLMTLRIDFGIKEVIRNINIDSQFVNFAVLFVMILLVSYVRDDNTPNCKNVMIVLGISIFLSLHFIFQMTEYITILEILNVISFVSLSLMIIFLMPFCSMTLVGMIFYLIGGFIVFPIGKIIIFVTQYNISTHCMCMILSIIFIIFHFLSTVCYFLAIFYFVEFTFEINDDQLVNVHIFLSVESYTNPLITNGTENNQDENAINTNQNEPNNEINANVITHQNFEKSDNSESINQNYPYTGTY